MRMFGKKFIPGVRVEVDADSEEFNPNKVITFFYKLCMKIDEMEYRKFKVQGVPKTTFSRHPAPTKMI